MWRSEFIHTNLTVTWNCITFFRSLCVTCVKITRAEKHQFTLLLSFLLSLLFIYMSSFFQTHASIDPNRERARERERKKERKLLVQLEMLEFLFIRMIYIFPFNFIRPWREREKAKKIAAHKKGSFTTICVCASVRSNLHAAFQMWISKEGDPFC